mgnify:CR=1 FL=1
MDTKYLLEYSVYASLIIQVITALANIWVLQFKTPKSVNLIRELIYAELGVQLIEVIFYIWLAYNFFKIKNITPARYYDWMFTTPTMLITLICYFVFLKYKDQQCMDTSILNLADIIKKEYIPILIICGLNALMLLMGYLGEIKKLPMKTSVFFGKIIFLIYFFILYKYYVEGVKETYILFSVFMTIWSFYGVAALLPYDWKNISLNILDLFSKNFFGVFLTIVLYQSIHH